LFPALSYHSQVRKPILRDRRKGMALSSGLHEALGQFVGTELGSKSEKAAQDLAQLDELSRDNLANYEDGAFNILASLYGIEAPIPDSGEGTDSVSVKKK
jgi:hypothetical protein